MKKQIIQLIRFFALFAACTNYSFAADNQLYFTAKADVLGASSQSGKDGIGVYLRWDVVEGDLPSDLASFRLERSDGVILLENKGINTLMPEAEITQIYTGIEEQQRLFNTLALLKKYVLADSNDAFIDFDTANFEPTLLSVLNSDQAWSYFSSRQNFNIAQTRYRAFLDKNISANSKFTYTLYAVSTTNVSKKVGEVTVDVSKRFQLLPVNNFHQLPRKTCDIADNMLDHNTVFLDWFAAGNNFTDQAANSLQLAGYLLYRSKADIATGSAAPIRNLAAEALNLNHDAQGNMQFVDLEMASSSLIISEGSGSIEDRKAAFVETAQALMAAGLKPGDKRAYYIVPVDFAGKLGKTSAAIVQIPNRLRPATPWNIHYTQTIGETPSATIEWDESTFENYQANFSFSRVICNQAEAQAGGKIKFARNLASCDTPRETRIDIAEYLVYRFDTATQAGNFVDSDGDGFSDEDENILNNDACDATDQPVINDAKNYLVGSGLTSGNFEQINLTNNRSKIDFKDSFLTRPENVGEVFWYRIASRTADGNVSHLSAALRAVFWDMSLPQKPTVVTTVQGNCCEITRQPFATSNFWKFTDTLGQSNTISLKFKDDASSVSQAVALADFTSLQSDVCSSKGSPIAEFIGTSLNPPRARQLLYKDICIADIPNDMGLCQFEGWQIAERQCSKPLIDGSTIPADSKVTYDLVTKLGNCISVYDRIDGQRTLVATSCGTATPEALSYLASAGFCGEAISRDPSGNVSPPLDLACAQNASAVAPNPPQAISLLAEIDSATFEWRLPLNPVAITLIELSSDVDADIADETDKQIISVPSAGFSPAKIFKKTTAIHTLLAGRDTWCIRLKAVAPQEPGSGASLSSAWSNPLCTNRRANGVVAKEYMPWPKIQKKVINNSWPEVITVNNFVDDTAGGLNYEKMPLVLLMSDFLISQNLNCTFQVRPGDFTIDLKELIFSNPAICRSTFALRRIESKINKNLGTGSFIVYRQSRVNESTEGSWVQVSPLIEKVFWREQVDTENKSKTIWVLSDPYFKIMRKSYNNQDTWYLAYVDRYPYRAGYSYRYQIVAFNKEHAIKNIHQTSWVQTDFALQVQQGAQP